ncbi:MAC/perforin domain-containing protein [Bacteroides sp.]|uniref:MAC/perforin domain-containing protein n=1 Tax=Bacteroides sp. TaxID=29523 RepID=UPI002FC6D155
MKKIYSFIAIAILILSLGSCQKDKFNLESDVIIPDNANLMELEAYGYEQPIQIEANDDWTVECDGGWFYTIPEKGTSGTQKLLICVCTNVEDEIQPGKLIFHFKSGGQKVVELQQKVKDDNAIVSEGSKRYGIGYGYDCGNEYAHPNAVLGEIFKIKLLDSLNVIKANSGAASIEYSTITGNSIEDITSKLRTNAGVKGEYFGFKGEINASFDANSFNSEYSEFARHSGRFVLKSYYFGNSVDIFDYINQAAQDAIDGTDKRKRYAGDKGIKRLIENYGTHVIVKAYLGGRYDVSTTIKREKIEGDYDVNVYAKAAYANSFVDASAEVTADQLASFKKNKDACNTIIKTVGGSTDAVINIQKNGGIETWMTSLKVDENIALVDFGRESLIPIWELCSEGEDSPRALAIKAFIANPNLYDGSVVTAKMAQKIDIPTFSNEAQSTLVKTVVLTDGGSEVVEVCNEYIPQLSKNSRVTVIYPIVNGIVRYNEGFFTGSADFKPGRLSWNGDKYTYKENEGMPIGKLSSIYKRGLIFTTIKPTSEIQSVRVVDKCLSAYTHNGTLYNYPIVKIYNKYWLKQNYNASKKLDSWDIPNRKWSATVSESFYGNDAFIDDELRIRGWTVPSETDYRELLKMLSQQTSILTGAALCIGGVTGFDASCTGFFGPYGAVPTANTQSEYWTSNNCHVRISPTSATVEGVDPSAYKIYWFSIRWMKKLN